MGYQVNICDCEVCRKIKRDILKRTNGPDVKVDCPACSSVGRTEIVIRKTKSIFQAGDQNMKNSTRPCDCKSIDEATRLLNEQGLSFNNYSFRISPNVVYIESMGSTLRMPMNIFKRFSEWFLEEQEKND